MRRKDQWFGICLCLVVLVGCGGDSPSGGAAGGQAMTTAGTGTAGTGGTAAPIAGTTAGGAAGMTAAAGGSRAAGAGTTATPPATAGMGASGMGAAAGSGGMNAMTTAGSSAAGQGGAAAGTPGGAAGAGGMPSGGMLGGPLMYTGPFTMGMTIPEKNKCASMGENVSPPLSWKGGSPDTKSFAIVLYDTMYNMLHWVIWDIPPTVNELPEGLASGYTLTTPMGAHQVANMGDDRHAYAGPCSGGGFAGTYEYRLYALNTAMLALTESSTPQQAQMAVEAAMLEMTVWTGKPM